MKKCWVRQWLVCRGIYYNKRRVLGVSYYMYTLLNSMGIHPVSIFPVCFCFSVHLSVHLSLSLSTLWFADKLHYSKCEHFDSHPILMGSLLDHNPPKGLCIIRPVPLGCLTTCFVSDISGLCQLKYSRFVVPASCFKLFLLSASDVTVLVQTRESCVIPMVLSSCDLQPSHKPYHLTFAFLHVRNPSLT